MTENGTVQTTRPDWFPAKPLEYWPVRLKLVEIVAAKPEGYRYERREGRNGELTCLYWHEGEDSGSGEPGCIIGQLLASLGAPGEFLAQCDDGSSSSSLDNLIKRGKLDGVFEDRTALALRYLQCQQDSGMTWDRAMQSMENFWCGLRALEHHQIKRTEL